MNIEEGLLNSIIDKLRSELQGMIRYELSRGLDKPEANNWISPSPTSQPFPAFLNSTLTNALYPKETLKVSDYLLQTQNMMQKFKFFKEVGQFFLPSDVFFTNSYMSDLTSGQKQLITLSQLQFSTEDLAELKAVSHMALSNSVISPYLPSNFTKSHHDPEYVSKLMLSLDPESARDLIQKKKIFSALKSFKLPNIQYKFGFIPPCKIDTKPLWESVSSVFECLEEIRGKIQGMETGLKAETENKRIVAELVSKNYNDEVFDQLLEMSN